MRSLTLKLVLAFLVVGLTGAAMAAIFARWATTRAFGRLVVDQAQADFISNVSTYYKAKGSWSGVADSLPTRRRPAGPPPTQTSNADRPNPRPPADPNLPPYSFVLLDQNRTVVVPGSIYEMGEQVPPGQPGQETPIEIDGQVVGTLLTNAMPLALDPREASYLARTDQGLVYSALIAITVALILGILLARTLAHPIAELTAATRAMAKGELGQQVTIRSRDELGELASAFNQMSADLAHANRLRQQMTADIAHELRSPLTVITGYLEGLRNGVLRPTSGRFEIMFNEARQLQRLVEDLRTLSLADAGELPLSCQPTDPPALLTRIADTLAQRARQAGITLEIETAGPVPDLLIDPERIVQVMENLVNNAVRHTPSGGKIILSAYQADGQVLLSVQDSGEGIPPDILPHIFDRFYRGDPSRSQEGGESGLGLAIAKSIVEAHHGTITASSRGTGQGSTFVIHLPAGAARA